MDGHALPRGWLWVALGVGLALRVGIVAGSIGSDDIHIWERFATIVERGGLLGRYGEIKAYGFPMNHPPVAVGLSVLALTFSQWTGLSFALVFKLPMIAADLAIALLLARLAAREASDVSSRAVAIAYTLSPVAILISAYHGNTDCLATALAFASAALLMHCRPGAAGLALGAALNIKLIPILLLPVLFLQCRDLPSARRFAAGFGVALLPFLPFVAAQPMGFYQATLGYGSFGAVLFPWGFNALLMGAAGQADLKPWVVPVFQAYRAYGTGLLLILVAALAIVGRSRGRWTPIELGGACLALFLTFAPGFGIQYLVYVLPFALWSRWRIGMAYSLFAGAFALLVYGRYWTGTFPIESKFKMGFPPDAQVVGLMAWGVLLVWLVGFVRSASAPQVRESGRSTDE